MKKIRSQIVVALVCSILGFMLAYQFRMISIQESNLNMQGDSSQITTEITQLKSQKDDLTKDINNLQDQIKKYQNSVASRSTADKQMLDELNNLNILTGSVDVKGSGIILTITPKNTVFSSDITSPKNTITDDSLITIVNDLNFAGAEAISINDIRITPQTAIKATAGSSAILIGNNEKISPYEKITIKAIGNKDKLNAAMVFPGELSSISVENYDIPSPVKSSSISIPRSNKVMTYEYAKSVSN